MSKRTPEELEEIRQRRREFRIRRLRRLRRRGRRAYIQSVYFLPSMATLGNAICGFGAMYVCTLRPTQGTSDSLTWMISQYPYVFAVYLIFLAMFFDAIDGRLARFARHTTDFGGQLDSLADVISFGAAPAFLALQVFKEFVPNVDPALSRTFWACGAVYMSCAALRLARFNVSNEHGEQHHFSFLGLPSPGAGGTIAALVLLIMTLRSHWDYAWMQSAFHAAAHGLTWALPPILLGTGLLMVSNIRYPHVVNRYLRGRRSIQRLVVVLLLAMALIVAHQFTVAIATLAYCVWGVIGATIRRVLKKPYTVPSIAPAAGPKA